MGYPNRRYRVVDGKLEKVWNGTNDPGWFMTKAEAWAAEEARLNKAEAAKLIIPFGDWVPDLPPPTPETELVSFGAAINEPAETLIKTVEAGINAGGGYETWKGPALRSEIKARTGKGPKVGADSSKVAMIERLRDIDAQRDGFEQKMGEAYKVVDEPDPEAEAVAEEVTGGG